MYIDYFIMWGEEKKSLVVCRKSVNPKKKEGMTQIRAQLVRALAQRQEKIC